MLYRRVQSVPRFTPLTVTGCTSDGAVEADDRRMRRLNGRGLHQPAASDVGANTNKVVVTVRDATKTKEREVTGTDQRFGDGQA